MAVNRDLSSILAQFSGKLGNVIIKNYGDKIVLSAPPDMSKRKLSPKQKEMNLLMNMANKYAKKINDDPVRKAEAAKILGVPGNKVFRALVSVFISKKGDINGLIKLTPGKAAVKKK
ncbi:hypothetical protein [Flavihumibacter profundi]|jgi:hypothetical protein|uniref:hypothetical protein n=1 Tax=Flavihumibacter profundi TaxID=2716883 RepID=UPI001CC667B9|nr:hypothetical protein [Flavihumibacter profundi]MBZ5855630.1 hypothetical protein [Flavihumibacter profundi]